MAKYQREHEYDLEEEDNIETVETELNPVEKTFEKRYADLRRYSANQVKELTDRIKALESPTEKEIEPPKSEADLAAWMRKFPDVAGMVRTLVMKELSDTRNEVKEIRNETTKERKQRAKDEAQAELARLHPDFFGDIINREDFHEWIQSKSQYTQDALFVNETDADRAAEVITLYKLETGNKKRKITDKRDAASDIPSRGVPSVGEDNVRSFKESEIDAMSGAEYEKYEGDIEAARRAGRIDYDLSGAAR
jgi:hypothetical protein